MPRSVRCSIRLRKSSPYLVTLFVKVEEFWKSSRVWPHIGLLPLPVSIFPTGVLSMTPPRHPLEQKKSSLISPRTIRLAADDNVVVAVDPVAPGVDVAGFTVRERVPRGHKVAVAPIGENEPVRKYGQIIGFASKSIAPGEWVHEHNVALHDFTREYRFCEGAKNDEVLPPELRATFAGYLRANGKAGTRNYIGVLTSVNCSASVAKFIVEAVNRSGVLADYLQIDGVAAFVHGTGCGMASYGEGWEVLRRTQWGYATHANLGATLMVGLGCEVFQIDRMKDEYGLVEGDHFSIHDHSGDRWNEKNRSWKGSNG